MKLILFFICIGLLVVNVSAFPEPPFMQEIEVAAGKNDITFTILPENNTRENVLNSVDGLYTQIKTIEDDVPKIWDESFPYFAQSLSEISFETDYQIFMRSAQTIAVEGLPNPAVPFFINESTPWINVTMCQINDSQVQSRNTTVIDFNGFEEEQIITEFQSAFCDYCQPDIQTVETSWVPITACEDNKQTKARNVTTFDANHASCYGVTGLPSDLFNNGENSTVTEFQEVSCSPPAQVIIDQVLLLPDDSEDAGFQVLPQISDDVTVSIQAEISHLSESGTVSADTPKGNIELIFLSTIDEDTNIYEGSFSMESTDEPLLYSVIVDAIDGNATDQKIAQFQYLELAALDIDTTQIVFPIADPNGTVQIFGDTDMQTAAPTIQNIGNIDIDIEVAATDLTGPDTIPVNNLFYRFFSEFIPFSITFEQVNVNLDPDDTLGFDLQLFVPQGTQSGDYIGDIQLIAIER